MRRLSMRGDTLVEVLLAMAVLGSVIGISYATATASQRNSESSQERAEATTVAQGQAERLRAIRDIGFTSSSASADFAHFFTSPFNYTAFGESFCVPGKPTLPLSQNEIQDGNSISCLFGSSGRYRVKTTYASSTFTINVTWQPPVKGPGSSLSLEYRIW